MLSRSPPEYLHFYIGGATLDDWLNESVLLELIPTCLMSIATLLPGSGLRLSLFLSSQRILLEQKRVFCPSRPPWQPSLWNCRSYWSKVCIQPLFVLGLSFWPFAGHYLLHSRYSHRHTNRCRRFAAHNHFSAKLSHRLCSLSLRPFLSSFETNEKIKREEVVTVVGSFSLCWPGFCENFKCFPTKNNKTYACFLELLTSTARYRSIL